MSIASLDTPLPHIGEARRPSLARLAAVELRKMTDTRAGFWLLLSVAALMVTVVIITVVFGDAEERTLRNLIASAGFPPSVLLAVVGILLMTSEWSQRTGMITFALVPNRSRVIAAKLAAGVALSLAAFVVAIVAGVVGAVVAGSDADGAWSLPAALLGQDALLAVASMLMGLAFGAMLLSTPPAIVLYLGLPLGFTALAAIPGIEGPAGWLDRSRSLAPMTEQVVSPIEWARAGTTLAVWVALPLAIGLWRISRSEVK
jgi:ABC-2 type transport system permease protein